mgnify:CR=1 FL=1
MRYMFAAQPICILWDASHIWGLMAWRAVRALGLPCRLVKGQEIAEGAYLGKPGGVSPNGGPQQSGAGVRLLLVPGGNARLKAAALGALAGTFQADGSGPDAFAPLLLSCCLAGMLARCMVFAAMRVPSARPGGLGEALHEGVTSRHELIAFALGLGVCAVNGMRGLYALAIALLAAWLLLSAARKRLGGVTGDVFGCLVELTECVVLIVCCV